MPPDFLTPERKKIFFRKIDSKKKNFIVGDNDKIIRAWYLSLRKTSKFHLISCCGNFLERHSLRVVSGDLPGTMRKMCLSTKLPRQEIRLNYRILRSLPSKWSVCRSIVIQINVGTSRTKLSTLLKTNIFKYCALFCNKVAKVDSQ